MEPFLKRFCGVDDHDAANDDDAMNVLFQNVDGLGKQKKQKAVGNNYYFSVMHICTHIYIYINILVMILINTHILYIYIYKCCKCTLIFILG